MLLKIEIHGMGIVDVDSIDDVDIDDILYGRSDCRARNFEVDEIAPASECEIAIINSWLADE